MNGARLLYNRQRLAHDGQIGTPQNVDWRPLARGGAQEARTHRYSPNMQVRDRAIRPLSLDEIGALEKAATSVDTLETEYMDSRVFDLSLKAKDAGDERLADTYRLLAGVLRPRVELMGDIDSSTNQFHVTPSSLTEEERALLATLVEHVGDPELRARFADYLWIAKRDRKYGEIAVDDYLASALRLRDPEKWPGCAGRYERAAKLAASLGKKNERFTRTVRIIEESINDSAVARQLLHADVIFGCTDKELPRAILCRIATRYLIPVIDMGVIVSSVNGVLTGVTGRITTMFPGTSCLMCRERISPAMIRAESLPPEERRNLAAEGYAPELDVPNPAVIPFTTAVAAFAVGELLHRLTGYMGDRVSTETLIQFDRAQLRSNATPAEAWCDCANAEHWGRGDEDPFLGMS
jgi:hypothetical protein